MHLVLQSKNSGGGEARHFVIVRYMEKRFVPRSNLSAPYLGGVLVLYQVEWLSLPDVEAIGEQDIQREGGEEAEHSHHDDALAASLSPVVVGVPLDDGRHPGLVLLLTKLLQGLADVEAEETRRTSTNMKVGHVVG